MQMWHVTVGPLSKKYHLWWQMNVELRRYPHSIFLLLAEKWAFWCWLSPSAVEADGGVGSVHFLTVRREVLVLHGHVPVSVWLCFSVKVSLRSSNIPSAFFPGVFWTTQTLVQIFSIISPKQPATNKVLHLVCFGFTLFVTLKKRWKCLCLICTACLTGCLTSSHQLWTPAGHFRLWHLLISEQVESEMSFPESWASALHTCPTNSKEMDKACYISFV